MTKPLADRTGPFGIVVCCVSVGLVAGLVPWVQPAFPSENAPVAGSAATLKSRATEKIRNGRYVGTRGDGFYVDHLFCPGGNYVAKTTSPSGGPTGVSEGTDWKVAEAKRKKNGFVATIRDNKEGFEILLRKRAEKWSISVSFGTPDWGRVERSRAKSACEEL
jgi:hypothetical protein